MGILLREYKGKCHIKGKHRRLEETIHVHAEVGKNIKSVAENKKKRGWLFMFWTLILKLVALRAADFISSLWFEILSVSCLCSVPPLYTGFRSSSLPDMQRFLSAAL